MYLLKWENTTKQQYNTICAEHHYATANTNNVNKTRTLLQITGGKDEPNIVLYAEIIKDITTRNSERICT